MANALICFPIASDQSTLTGGNWLAGLPLSNLQLPGLEHLARSTNDAHASTIINEDAGSSQYVRVVALVRSNVSAAAQWRFRMSENADMSAPVFDSTQIDCWPEQWPVGLLYHGHPNAADRRFTNADIARLRWDLVMVLPPGKAARYRRLEIFDDTNPAGYVEAARLVMAPAFQPTANMNLGVELGSRENSVIEQSLSGVTQVDVRSKRRSASMTFGWLRTDEALLLNDLRSQLGFDQQFYFVFDPDDTYNLQRRSFLAQQRELSAMQLAFHDVGANPMAIDEVL